MTSLLKLLGLLNAAAVICSPTVADTLSPQAARDLVEKGEILPLSEVLSRRAPQAGSEVIEAVLERQDGRYRYRIKTLDEEGRCREFLADAEKAPRAEKE